MRLQSKLFKHLGSLVVHFIRMSPGFSVIAIFMWIYLSPLYANLPPDGQLFLVKLFLAVMPVVVAHYVGKLLLPSVVDWSDTDQPFVKIARIALYVTIPIATSLGG